MSVLQKIKEIEDEMARTQKNKATAGHLGMLKVRIGGCPVCVQEEGWAQHLLTPCCPVNTQAKLAKLRRELLEPSSGAGGGGKGDGFDVNKVGDARVGLVGFPSVGKSTLLNKLTGTFSEVRRESEVAGIRWSAGGACLSWDERAPSIISAKRRAPFPFSHSSNQVAAYEFTTLTCVPGVIRYRGAKIQLLDLPGIIEGAKDGKGRGRQVIATARTCDLILIVLDCLKPITHKKLIEHELEGG